jgi:hypothetical protein
MPNNMSQRQKKGRPPRGKPVSEDGRMANYERQAYALSGGRSGHRATRDGFTGPQRRRLTHKDNHASASFGAGAGQEAAA